MRFRKILGLNGAWLPDSFFFETYSGKETRIGIWMDPENKPNKQRTRIGGGYMVVDGSGGDIWQRWWYMDTDLKRWRISGGGRWQGR